MRKRARASAVGVGLLCPEKRLGGGNRCRIKRLRVATGFTSPFPAGPWRRRKEKKRRREGKEREAGEREAAIEKEKKGKGKEKGKGKGKGKGKRKRKQKKKRRKLWRPYAHALALVPVHASRGGGVVTAECGVVHSGRQDTRGHYAACGIEPNILAARPSLPAGPARPSPPSRSKPAQTEPSCTPTLRSPRSAV